MQKKLYTIASNKKFTQGRNTKHIVGAILYLACRKNQTTHLLIDFSEVLRVNLFIIGSLYIKLIKITGQLIQIIDPSLYMHRFCNKFNFGNNAKEIERTALKILQFMKRDWITTGRRPSGLCGACILISAKLHNFNIDINLLSDVVHVSPQTIQNRIEEFSLTKVASMTKEQFEAFKEGHYYPGADPPAFLKGLMEDKEEKDKKEIIEENKEKIENGAN
jgi:transcription factor IIIB subunit 2